MPKMEEEEKERRKRSTSGKEKEKKINLDMICAIQVFIADTKVFDTNWKRKD